MANRGIEFERELRDSIPPRVYHRKLSTPAPPPQLMQQVVAFLEKLGAPGWMLAACRRATFTPKSPYDLLIVGPLLAFKMTWHHRDQAGLPLAIPLQPGIFIALEVKSCGSAASLAFSRVKDHQVEGLLAAARAGHVAGLVVEFPAAGEHGEAWFIPVQNYAAYVAGANRASLPLAAARIMGMPIMVNLERGRRRKYWRVGDWLSALGAGVSDPIESAEDSVEASI